MKYWLVFLAMVWPLCAADQPASPADSPDSSKKVFILPIRDDINSAMVYLIRRGVKQAMEAEADVLVIHMDTNGGLVNSTEKIMEILNLFPNHTVTFVDKKAFSAGAFISVATKEIYMAPQSVIGAAAPIMLSPGGAGAEDMPNTMEVKMTSALSALVRASAQKNGHDPEVIEAMINKSKELKKDGTVLSEKGQILTLTNVEAEREYGDPPRPLLSAGTMESLDALLEQLGYANAEITRISPTGAEKLAFWLNAISPLLLIIGVIGIYIEFKTPGFGLPGIIGVTAFALYFLGGYVAGLSGWEWVVLFILGLVLVIIELFVFPGTILVGLAGAALMLASVIMALVDLYPNPGPGLPTLPQFETFQLPLRTLLIAMAGSAVAVWLLSRYLPRTSLYRAIVSHSASGVQSEALHHERGRAALGQVGMTVSTLRPGGKAQFGERILDVTSQGDLIAQGTKVRVLDYRGNEAVVEVIE